MASGEYEAIMNGFQRRVQSKGEVTLPKEWREAHGVEPGDDVALKIEDGEVRVIPPGE